MTGLSDSFQRPINYLRISVTDRCNLRCIYCMPSDGICLLSHRDILTYEEIYTIVQAAAELGINKVRITGGEPLVRAGISELIRMLARIDTIDDISLTTNGTLLGGYAAELKQAGLRRVNVSLDTLKADRFQAISGSDRLAEVIGGITLAQSVGLQPVKINMVVLGGTNDDELLNLARMSLEPGWHVRFIEYMPLNEPAVDSSHWISVSEMMIRIEKALGKLEPGKLATGAGPARYYRLPGARGTLGFISPMTDCFCSECNRLRLTADGRLRPCLVADDEVDLKGPMRNGAG
ncbi:MAG: GTP 3',8-cyclase MoaA, partial [Dehalococcoidales bacterium]|nr:GTP 3',8-cyclase MoaA [Dehalococcoidales bacterium]